MSKISCDIVKDMLPLYYDNICSNDSKQMVEEHLIECDDCKRELEGLEDALKISMDEIASNRNEGSVIKHISSIWNRSRVMSFIKGVLISMILLLLITLGYQWNIIHVPIDVVTIGNVSKLADGKIVYYMELTDGYDLNRVKYHMDNEGNFYMTPLRPVIKQQSHPSNTMVKGYEFFDIEAQELNHNGREIKALYYGTPKENILIWKEGMDLPKASREIEDMFRFN